MSARDQFRADIAEALTDWRLGCIPPRADWSAEQELFRAGVSEILGLRLRIAYTPIFKTLQRIENQLALLAAMREDPYAPPPRVEYHGLSARLRSTSIPRRSGP